jgi:hypothetical protein
MSNEQIDRINEYIEFAEKFYLMVKKELEKWEKLSEDENNLRELIHVMPSLISAVNTVGYLRGQDGMFSESKPPIPLIEDMNRLRSNEAECEGKLDELIKTLLSSKEKEYYIGRITSYFVKARSNQKPDVFW